LAIEVTHKSLGHGVVLESKAREWVVRFSDGDYRVDRSELQIIEDEVAAFELPLSLQPYHPYYGGLNPYFGLAEREILSLKNGNSIVAHSFAKRLAEVLPPGLPVAVIPPHDGLVRCQGITRVALELVDHGWQDATHCLVRVRAIEKLASGGTRSLQRQLGSMEVRAPAVFAGKRVILLDDVITSGNSLQAGSDLIRRAGATAVKCVALARTV
jgi:hypothetical protein